jgi:hypothetical protein
MEKSEQKFVIKFFSQRPWSKEIHRKLTAILCSTTYLLTQIKGQCVRFETSDLLCEDQSRPGGPLHILGKALSDFFEEFPFTTARVIAQHFNQSKYTIKEILQRELGLRRFSRRWVSHSVSEAQKADRTAMTIDMSSVLYQQANHSFSQIVTEDESLFCYLYPSDHMFAASRDKIIPREKAMIKAHKVMLTIFFSCMNLITLNTLSSGERFN